MKTTLEISGSRLAENFRVVSSVAGAGSAVVAVVKADAYGHGSALCAPVLVEAGAGWLGVGDADEGAAVRRVLGQGATRLLVMCGMELRDAGAMLAHGLTPVVWTAEHIAAMERAARSSGQRTAVHLEIDSGMSRQGAQPGSPLAETAAKLAGSRWLFCEGVLTHLANAEEVDSGVTATQRERFAAGLEQVLGAGLQPEWVHMANSSALDEASTTGWLRRLARTHGAQAMVRTGLAVYGHCLPLVAPARPGSENPDADPSEQKRSPGTPDPHPSEQKRSPGTPDAHPSEQKRSPGTPDARHLDLVGTVPALRQRVQPVLRWTTCVTGVREIAAGEPVGYGATWIAPRPTQLALLPVGYADGFRRGASSGVGDGWVVIGNKRAPVVGRVSMNLTTVDITALTGVREGAEVTLMGPGVTVEDHARWSGTIPYEILCGLRGHRELR